VSEILEKIKLVDWRNGIMTKSDAERFIKRLIIVLLQSSIKNGTKIV
jgi:hypothetical protein